jgi:hypothetical protein
VSAIARHKAPTDQTRGSESTRMIKKPYFLRVLKAFSNASLYFQTKTVHRFDAASSFKEFGFKQSHTFM